MDDVLSFKSDRDLRIKGGFSFAALALLSLKHCRCNLEKIPLQRYSLADIYHLYVPFQICKIRQGKIYIVLYFEKYNYGGNRLIR